MDAVGKTLLQRINELLKARPDVDRQAFGRAIGRRTPSWLSEFFSGKRTTNDLRLVLTMARFFRVPVGYLLSDVDDSHDAETLTLLGAWKELHRRQDRGAVLQLVLALRRGAAESPEPDRQRHEGSSGEPRSPLPSAGGSKRKSHL